ncbi:hypothetical protein JAAARDRAFT_49301 [Jaapia argillacea MUCL 33604]|uniref:Uncharacterized protein n=1 Tax=Jaapia argillacea MUCL 33604 TaxID=933084 RepID=A0A067PVA3_9AGAM|nr:hypothetical protein JAAARDRAFT_49301 [Jaapia argillacea MUCL 33604]
MCVKRSSHLKLSDQYYTKCWFALVKLHGQVTIADMDYEGTEKERCLDWNRRGIESNDLQGGYITVFLIICDGIVVAAEHYKWKPRRLRRQKEQAVTGMMKQEEKVKAEGESDGGG